MAVKNLTKYDNLAGSSLPISFKRGNPVPLDGSLVWSSLAKAQEYATSSPVAYVGQIISVVTEETSVAYIIADETGTLKEVGSATSGDNATIELSDEGVLTLVGFANASNGAQLVKGTDGKLSWVVPDTTTVEGLSTTVGTLSTSMEDLSGKVNTLIGDDANKSVRTIANEELAAQLIPETAKESLDTLQEIAAWIQAHPEDAAAMNDKITALEGKVGDDSVADQIDDAIKDALTENKTEGEGKDAVTTTVDKYAKATDLTALEGRVTTNETDIADLKSALGENGSVAEQIEDAIHDALTVTTTITEDEEGNTLDTPVTKTEDKYALKNHTHTIADVTGLQEALNAKASDADFQTVSGTVSALETQVATLEEAAFENHEVLEGITAEKVTAWDEAQTNVLEAVKVNGTALAIEDKAVNLQLSDEFSIDKEKVSVDKIEISKIYQSEDTEIVFNGGNASSY